MQAKQKIMVSLIALLLIALSLSCTLTKEPGKFSLMPTYSRQPQEEVKQLPSDAVAKRFKEPDSENPSPVESAMALSKKYARLSEETSVLRREKEDLISKNRRLEDLNSSLKTQLLQTQKELTEANDLMIEMRIELNNWRTDILGFRDEMRDADATQLQALLRILKILGGETKAELAQNENTGSDPASQSRTSPSEM